MSIRLFNIGSHAEADEVQYSAVTDSEGRFGFDDVKPGAYRVSYDRAGFVDVEKYNRGDGMLLTVQPQQDTKELLFHMAPTAVIRGRVLDVDGDPLPNVDVSAMPYPHIPHALEGGGGSFTNELGEFRIGGLASKQYLLVAQPVRQLARAVQTAKTNPTNAPVYASTYYPGTSDPNQAVPVRVRAGDEIEASIRLVLVHSLRIRGEVIGIPASATGSSLLLRPLDDMFMSALQTWSLDKDGHFEVREVLPGSYAALVVFSDGKTSHTVRGDQIIQAGSTDIQGLRIVALPNGDVRGQFRVEDDKRVDWSQLRVGLYSDQTASRNWAQGTSTSSGDELTSIYWDDTTPRAEVKPDGSFEMKDVPADTYRLHVVATNDGLADYYVRAVNLEGKDVIDSGFITTGTTQKLDVVLSAKGASLEGVVTGDNDLFAPYVKVICIPDAKRRERQDLFQEATTDGRGHFSLRGLSPGEYRIMALDEKIDEEITDPEFVRAHELIGRTVSFDEGEHKSVTLKLEPTPE